MNDFKKIVFLDIDGVLASTQFLCDHPKSSGIDPEKCKLLNTLSEIGAEIVISSSWGYDNGRTEKTLRQCGLTLPIIGYTQHFPKDWICRGNEIEKWLTENYGGMGTKFGYDRDTGEPYYRKHFNDNDVDYEYVIFDDDTDFLLGQKDNFIRIDERTGLMEEDINKAIKILTRSK